MSVEEFNPDFERGSEDDPRSKMVTDIYRTAGQMMIDVVPGIDQVSVEFSMAKLAVQNLACLNHEKMADLLEIWAKEIRDDLTGEQVVEKENEIIKYLLAGLEQYKAMQEGGSC